MSTRSAISMREENGSIRSIYCHFDGYPTGVGEMLLMCYRNVEIVRELMDGGDRSVLGESPSLGLYSRPGDNMSHGGDAFPSVVSVGLNDFHEVTRLMDWLYLYEPNEDQWYFTSTENKFWRELRFTDVRPTRD